MKALIGFDAFYFFGSVSVQFRCVCEMALTENNPLLSSRREENGHRNYFMVNLHESMGPARD